MVLAAIAIAGTMTASTVKRSLWLRYQTVRKPPYKRRRPETKKLTACSPYIAGMGKMLTAEVDQ